MPPTPRLFAAVAVVVIVVGGFLASQQMRLLNRSVGGDADGEAMAAHWGVSEKNQLTNAHPVTAGVPFRASGVPFRAFQGRRSLQSVEVPLLRGPPSKGMVCSRFAVVLGRRAYAQGLGKSLLPDMKEWCLVVVEDEGTPEDYVDFLNTAQAPGIILLSIRFQKSMALSSAFVASLPWGHVSRINVGFM